MSGGIGNAAALPHPDMTVLEVNMPKKTIALVTGANKGIGLEIARRLGERRFAVWLGCRDPERGEVAAAGLREAGVDARAITLDVSDGDSVAKAATRLEAEAGGLDVLVNNAGVSLGSPPPGVTEEAIDDVRAMFEVNTLGPLRVTQAVLPLLRKSAAPRIVMMSSGLGSISDTADMASLIWNVDAAGYSASKAALNMLTVKLAKALLDDGIKVNAADPGYTATDLNGHNGARTVEEAATIAAELATLGPLGPTGGFFNDGHVGRMARYRW